MWLTSPLDATQVVQLFSHIFQLYLFLYILLLYIQNPTNCSKPVGADVDFIVEKAGALRYKVSAHRLVEFIQVLAKNLQQVQY